MFSKGIISYHLHMFVVESKAADFKKEKGLYLQQSSFVHFVAHNSWRAEILIGLNFQL